MCLKVQAEVNEEALREAGYVKLGDNVAMVTVSRNLVAQILGVSLNTVISYVETGHIIANEENKISLDYALKLDKDVIKRAYLKSRTLVVRPKKRKKL